MGLIEQAYRRLEALRRAGIEVAPPVARVRPRVLAAVPAAASDRGGSANEPLRAARSRRVALDRTLMAAAGLVRPEDLRSQISEEYRALKRPLLSSMHSVNPPIARGNCIVVTSAGEGEGKTFTALNLAISIATEVDHHVLLVDADVLRPTLLDRVGVQATEGFLDLLQRPDGMLSDTLLATDIDKLTLLPCGAPRPNAAELLGSRAMLDLVEELASRYPDRIVILDAPPLLVSNEARALAACAGQVIVVVEAQRTSEAQLREAMKLVQTCPVVMTLLNKAARPTGSARYGYYG